MLEFVDSDLYFVQDKNNFINLLLQVGSGSGYGSVEKISGSGVPKITGSDRIRILIPGFFFNLNFLKVLSCVSDNLLNPEYKASPSNVPKKIM